MFSCKLVMQALGLVLEWVPCEWMVERSFGRESVEGRVRDLDSEWSWVCGVRCVVCGVCGPC